MNQTDTTNELIESSKHENDLEFELLIKPKQPLTISKSLSAIGSSLNRPLIKINKASVKRTLSTANTIRIQRKKRIGLIPIIIDNRHSLTPSYIETTKKKDISFKNKPILNIEKDDHQSNELQSKNVESTSLFSVN
jgi:hypothetical protein